MGPLYCQRNTYHIGSLTAKTPAAKADVNTSPLSEVFVAEVVGNMTRYSCDTEWREVGQRLRVSAHPLHPRTDEVSTVVFLRPLKYPRRFQS